MNAIGNGILTGPYHDVEVDAYRLEIKEHIEFDSDRFCIFVATHGYGEPTEDGYVLGSALIRTGDDYSTAAHEIVMRKLTTRPELDD